MSSLTLHSEISGQKNAPPLLLLNSLGASNAMWDLQIEMLEAQFQVIRCDTRGHGASPSPSGAYSFEMLIGDVLHVLDKYRIGKTAVMGLSLGGMTALGLGLQAPNRIEKIICCAARADAPPAFVNMWNGRQALLEEQGISAVWEATVDKWISDDTRNDHTDREALLREAFLKTTKAGYSGCAEALKKLDFLKNLSKLKQPTLFVAGSEDPAAPPQVMQAMAAACPGSLYAEVPAARHIINMDNPDGFVDAIAGFLDLNIA